MSKKSNFQIAIELGAKMDPSMKKAFNSARGEMNNFGNSVGKAAKYGAKAVVGISTAMVGIGVAAFAMTNKVVGNFDTIAKNSKKLGVSTTAYQEMDYWAGQNGISAENMEKTVGRLNQRIGLAAKGNKKYSEGLEALGVDMAGVKNGTVSTEEAMYQSMTALAKMTNEQEKSAVASEIFGSKLAMELMPALQDSALSLEDAKKKAEQLGIVVGEDTLKAAEKFGDTWDDITRSFQVFGQKGIAMLMPKFQYLMDWTLTNMPIIQEKINVVLSKVQEYLKGAFEKAKPAIEWISNTGIPKAKEAIITIMTNAMKFYNFIKNNWSTIKPIVIGLATGILILKGAMLTMAIVQTVTGYFKLFQAGTIAAKLSMLGLNGAMLANPMLWVVAGIIALIAVGVLLYKNWDTVKAKSSEAWAAIVNVIRGPVNTIIGFANAIILAFENMINAVGTAVNKIPSVSLPSWLGGGEFGIPKIPNVTLPRIPMLAQGGITTGPTLAMIGEGSEQEAILPISKLQALLNGSKNNTVTNNNQKEKRTLQIVYSPKFIVKSSATKKDLEEVTSKGFEEFKRWIKKYEDEKGRLSF